MGLTYAVLVVVAAVVTWTVTKEEIFRSFRAWLDEKRRAAKEDERELREARPYSYLYPHSPTTQRAEIRRAVLRQKLAYMPTCDYCFAHWVMLALVLVVRPAPIVGTGLVGWGLTYFTLVAFTVVLTTLFNTVRQVNRSLACRADLAARALTTHEFDPTYRAWPEGTTFHKFTRERGESG